MKRFNSLHILLVMATIVVISCSTTPSGVLDPEDMASLMADVYRGEAVIDFNYSVYYNDSLKKMAKQSVFVAHGVDQECFDSSLSWYGHHIEQYIKVCDRAVEILESEAKNIPDDPSGVNHIVVTGDSAEVWPLSHYYNISPSTPTGTIIFNLPANETWEPGDEYTLAFKLINMRTPVNSLIAVDYDDLITEYHTEQKDEDGWSKITLRLDSTRTATDLYGYIELHPVKGENVYIDSISLIRTRVNPQLYRTRLRQKRFSYGNDNN